MAERADNKLVELGLAQSRERAKALIMEGVVLLDGVRVMKPSDPVKDGQVLSLKEDPIPFVSRGGLKLEKAVTKYGIRLENMVCVDVGASTGGFTDCMLKHGAIRVFAVDVGYGQLDWRLRNDERVVCMERHNARLMESAWFDETPSFASCDVSFISIRLILPRIFDVLAMGGEAVVLVKPQFEAGRNKIGKNGVVRERSTHLEVLNEAALFALNTGFSVLAVDHSPITGPKGNIEFLLYLKKPAEDADAAAGINGRDETAGQRLAELAGAVVDAAHSEFSDRA
ncbi:MAG: TlyA family RNA methyltransferase [Clostridia bacterium]|nr:TlyA family RNA methyltransferase [Clostridia bacterium]